jgi:hypothetical protein
MLGLKGESVLADEVLFLRLVGTCGQQSSFGQ